MKKFPYCNFWLIVILPFDKGGQNYIYIMINYKNFIIEHISSAYYPYRAGSSEFFLKYFLEHFEGIKCVFMYGSMLNPILSTSTSFPDFYVIVDDYKRFYKSNIHVVLNRILPPNSYFLKIDNSGLSMPFKYCVLDENALNRTTHYPGLKDFFVAGRLSKRIGILYVKDQKFLSQFLEDVYNAMRFNVMFAMSEMTKPFTLNDFILHLLGLSYRAEVRTETEDKIISIYNSEKNFYQEIYGSFLEQESFTGSLQIKDGSYVTIKPYFTEEYTKRFIKTSRKRAISRLSKSIYTFSNYVDYLESKVERTTGEKLELSNLDRRFPLIFGWRHVFKLLKKKAIR